MQLWDSGCATKNGVQLYRQGAGWTTQVSDGGVGRGGNRKALQAMLARQGALMGAVVVKALGMAGHKGAAIVFLANFE